MALAPECKVLVGPLAVSAMMTALWLVQREDRQCRRRCRRGWSPGSASWASSTRQPPAATRRAACWSRADRCLVRPAGRLYPGRPRDRPSGRGPLSDVPRAWRARRPIAGCSRSSRPSAGGDVFRDADPGCCLASRISAVGVGPGGAADLVHQRGEHEPRRSATRSIQAASGEPRAYLPRRRATAPSQLLFEWLHWWSYVVLAVGSAYWWLNQRAGGDAVFPAEGDGHPADRGRRPWPAAATTTVRVSCRTTSAFVPWFPRNAGDS